MLMKMAVLHKENGFWVGLLGAIHKKMNYIILLQKILRCARGLYHLIENWVDDLAKNADFPTRKLSLVCHVI